MDRKLLKAHFVTKSPPDWTCPTCRKSVLRIKKDTFHKAELRESREARDHDAWEPEWIRYTYSCLLECSNDACKEVVASVGQGNVDVDVTLDRNGEPEYERVEFFQPLMFHPALSLFSVPPKCPASVQEPLESSFRLFFSAPESALNSARVAVESLITELGIKKFQVQKGKRRTISLHARINLLPAKYVHVKDLLIAIKWLGNAGSHPGATITADDVLDAYELIEHVLVELYAEKAKAMKALAKKVNRRRGPKK